MNTRILLVDDEDYILQSYAKILSPDAEESASASVLAKRRGKKEQNEIKFPEYRLFFAYSGEEAIRIQQDEMRFENKIAVAFVDMKMPGGIDGLETIRALRQNDPDILCAVVTAYTDRSVLQISSVFDAPDDWIYFNKPFSKGELQQAAFHLVTLYKRREQNRQAQKMIEKLVNSYSKEKRMIQKLLENMPADEQMQKVLNWARSLL